MNSLVDGKYRIHRAIGHGCTGAVFHVEHEHIGTHSALKLLHEDLQQDDEVCKRFLAQAKAAARIQHTNVARIEDVGIADGQPYIVTELCKGRSLTSLICTSQLKLDEACEIGLHILAALAAAHENRIWHRDLKPENVMVDFDADGRPHVKVLDFGLTHAVFNDDGRYGVARWARSGPRYLAPEVLTGALVDERSDMYSVAAMMYEMLSGDALIEEMDELSAIKAIVAGQWEPLAQVNPSVPEPLVRAIEATLDSAVEARLASPQDLARQLIPYVATRLRKRDAFVAPTLDPVLRFSRRVIDREEPLTASLRLNLAPKPRKDPAVPQKMLMDPIFPRNAHAPRLESLNADAYGRRRKTKKKADLELETGPASDPLLKGAGRTAAVAVSAGFGLGAALAWLNAAM